MPTVPYHLEASRRHKAAALAVLLLMLAFAARISDSAQWRPTALVVALATVMVLADVAVVWARKLRVSPGLMVQTTMMALLGPAPAVMIGVLSIFLVDGLVYRVGRVKTMMNAMTAAVLGLAGGVLFQTLRAKLGLTTTDAGYAALVLPVYVVLAVTNLGVISAAHPHFERVERRRLFKEYGVPSLPLELLNGIFAATAVLLWGQRGYIAAAGLLAVLVVLIPLTRSVIRGDARAAEVARLASDRDRLLREVLDAEERERTRLAESLHDGPLQRLMALRQDAREPGSSPAAMVDGLDEAVLETRAIISALHPATTRELGFEASLRAAIAPFPAAGGVRLRISGLVGDTATLPLRIAQELVVNAVKHARPTGIDVLLVAEDDEIVLEVDDDGVGIDTADTTRAVQAGHVGLAMVRRRVEDAGGRFEIRTRPDGGTHSRVVLPGDLC